MSKVLIFSLIFVLLKCCVAESLGATCKDGDLDVVKKIIRIDEIPLNKETTFEVGTLGYGRNLDIFCYKSSHECSSTALKLVQFVNYPLYATKLNSTLIPYRFYGNGPDKFTWTGSINVTRQAGCAGVLTIFIGAVYQNEGICTTAPDSSLGQVLFNKKFSAKSKEDVFIPLGNAREIGFNCFNFFSNPLYPANLVPACSMNPTFSLELVTGPNCIFLNKELYPCCNMTKEMDCQSFTGGGGCLWAKELATCSPISNSVDITDIAVSGLKYEMVYQEAQSLSNSMNSLTPSRAQWGLRYYQNSSCPTHLDVSLIYTLSGGKCDEALIESCDRGLNECLLAKQSDLVELYKDFVFDGKTRYCSCMSLKEVCYRSASCIRGSAYKNVITDCSINGCGVLCSGASAVLPFASVILFAIFGMLVLL